MANYQGFVSKVQEKSGTSRGKQWTAYSFKVEKEDGSEYEEWFNFGFESPPFKEGDYITFQAEKNDKGYIQYVKGSGSKPKNPPARATGRKPNGGIPSDQRAAESTVGAAKADQSAADRQTQIVLQHSQEMAVHAVATLLTNNALPMSGANTKAGEAKRFNEITAAIDKFTVKFYNDVVTARLLDTVQDFIVDTKADGPLPAADPKKDAEQQDDGPTEDDLAGDKF